MTVKTNKLKQLNPTSQSIPGFSGVRVARSLVFCAMYMYNIAICPFVHCVVSPSSNGFSLLVLYLITTHLKK
jgi:hypothetical protein